MTTVPTPSTAVDPASRGPDDRSRHLRASLVGVALALVPFLWMAGAGHLDLLRSHPLGGFYDAQAHSFLDLRWDVPAEVLLAEAFTVDGRSYMYFGPTPALLRLPVAALTDAFDGRLTLISMSAGLVVALVASARLSWRVRTLLVGDAPVARRELVGAAAFTFGLGAASPLLFNASGPIVYHEAITWGVALALAAFVTLLRYEATGRRRTLALVVLLSALAVLARASVGMAPVLALGAVLLGRLVTTWRQGGGTAVLRRRKHLAALVVACVLPIAGHAAVNVAKFGTLFSVPFTNQAVTRMQPGRAEFLERTGGSLFGARYVPTTVLAYLRPDGLGLDRQFPWIGFPPRAHVVGDVELDVVDRSASLPATTPWLVALALGGAVVLVRRRSPGARRAASALWAPLAGAAAAPVTTVTIAYVAHRYLSDAIPLLVLAGAVGLHTVLHQRRRWTRPVLAGLALAGLAACWINLSQALLFQRFFGPPATEELRRELVAWQLDADRLLPGDQSPVVRAGSVTDVLPDDAAESELVVVGDCDGVYQFDGGEWRPVERTSAVGSRTFDLRLPLDLPSGGRRTVLAGGGAGERRTVALEPRPGGRLVVVVDHGGVETTGPVFAADAGTHRLDVHLDRRTHLVEVFLDGDRVHLRSLYGASDDQLAVVDDLEGALVEQERGTPLCDALRAPGDSLGAGDPAVA